LSSQRPILIVDDDESIRAALTQVLELGGYAVASAGDGAAALERLRSGERPALLLVDLVMPTLDGWQLCAELARDPDLGSIPVVILSAAWNLHNERTGGLQPAATLLKPINFKLLFEIVERFCGRARPAPREAHAPPYAKKAK
jgi:CheY-like chemotaxis protein